LVDLFRKKWQPKEDTPVTDDSAVNFKRPEELLTQLLREGAREWLSKAVEAELYSFLKTYEDHQVDGKAAIIRNGYLPARTIQTGLAMLMLKHPRVVIVVVKGLT